MNYFKGILSALAAIIATELLTIWWAIRATHSKATGLEVIVALLRESVFSPLAWSLAISLFAILFIASQLQNKPLRVLFFWIPTLMSCFVGLAITSLVAYLSIHFRST